jgi:hypothetical protein
MTKQQIIDKHGKLPEWLIQLILLLGETLLGFLIEKFKKKR